MTRQNDSFAGSYNNQDEKSQTDWVSDILDDDVREERARQRFDRYANYVRNENAKRQKIHDLASVLKMDEVILVLDMFLPSVTARTIMAGINDQMLPEPKFDR